MNDHGIKRKIAEIRELASQSVDGFVRPPELEEKINAAFRATFSSPSGQDVLEYLRSITTSAVLHPTCSDAELRAQEGARRLFGVIMNRFNAAP